MDVPISGRCDAPFSGVREEFVRNFAERGEVGAAVCVLVDDHVVVDLVGGWADEAGSGPGAPTRSSTSTRSGRRWWRCWPSNSSTTGRIGLDDPISSVWPEFGAGRQGAGPRLRHALCHRAGVPAIREPLTDDDLWDWDRMTGALAATEPWWEPGDPARVPHQHLRPPGR